MMRPISRASVALIALSWLGCDASLDPVGGVADPPITLQLEAEDYALLEARAGASNFTLIDEDAAQASDDPDAPHLEGTSGRGYLEALPDTFTADGEQVPGVNFTAQAGAGCTLTYRVNFHIGGLYFVWLRAYGGGAKDNSAFVGLNGSWNQTPVQVCGPPRWTWTSALRDEAAGGICSAEERASLQVDVAGMHNVQVSFREDGFELDQLLLTLDPNLVPTP